MVKEQEDNPKLQFPANLDSYRLLSEIGVGVGVRVYKAECVPMNSMVVAIKVIDLDQSKANCDSNRRKTEIKLRLAYPSILEPYCSFITYQKLWVVMPFMSGGSLRSIISSSFPDGLSEQCIAIILEAILNALKHLHQKGHLHRDIKTGNILMDSTGSFKLAYFGDSSSSVYESSSGYGSGSLSLSLSLSSSSPLMLTGVTVTPYWVAPEVTHWHTGYSFKADIWSFGITALELAHGRPPVSHLPPSESLIVKIMERFRFSVYESINKKVKNKTLSKAFKDMVASCLHQDPAKRPSAKELLKHPFFNESGFLGKYVLPSVEEKFKSKISGKPDGESGSQIVKHDGRASGWHFNEESCEMEYLFPNHLKDDSIAKLFKIIPGSTKSTGSGGVEGSSLKLISAEAEVLKGGNEGSQREGRSEVKVIAGDVSRAQGTMHSETIVNTSESGGSRNLMGSNLNLIGAAKEAVKGGNGGSQHGEQFGIQVPEGTARDALKTLMSDLIRGSEQNMNLMDTIRESMEGGNEGSQREKQPGIGLKQVVPEATASGKSRLQTSLERLKRRGRVSDGFC